MGVEIIIDGKEYSVEAAREIWEELKILFGEKGVYTVPYWNVSYVVSDGPVRSPHDIYWGDSASNDGRYY